jgi:thiol-disulfide isomerase/thioredoxin
MSRLRLALALVAGHLTLWAQGDIVSAVRIAAAERNFALGEREIEGFRGAAGVTPEVAEAFSWLARGAFEARQYDRADGYAAEAEKASTEILRKSGRGSGPLATALGASIEVHAEVLAARGQRTEAITYLRKQLAAYPHTPFASRIQKNINLLTLEGKPAPALVFSPWLGPRPPALVTLRGHPVLLFFWAHWCSDCKAEVPVLVRLMETYGPQGLVLIGPTQHYGYAAGGAEVGPQAETDYIDQVRRQYYAPLHMMSVPLSENNFERYGCSTTPTLVLLDGTGVVRLYHPGAMTYEALAESVRRALRSRASRSG